MANGLFAGGHGTELNPYLIEDAHDLNAVRNGLSKHYRLVNDIDLNIVPYNKGEGWSPVNGFSGVLEGQGHSILNLFISRPTTEYQGLFGRTVSPKGFTVKDIRIANVDIKGGRYTGTLAGHIFLFSEISNCSCENGSVQGSKDRVGGMVGDFRSSGSVMRNSYTSNISVIGTTSSSFVGGVAGVISQGATMENCYSNSSVTSTTSSKGGLTGYIGAGSGENSITNSFWDIEASGQATSAGGIGLTTEQMQTAQTFIDAGWDLELNEDGSPVWILEDGKYPKLWFEVERYSLIKYNERYYTYKNNEFIEVEPTEENFEEHSVNLMELLTPNEQGIKPLMTLDNPEIVLLTDKENPKLHIQGFRDLRPLCESDNQKLLINTEQLTNPVINTESIPQGQLILPTKDIYLRMLSNIHSFTATSMGDINGVVKIIFSVNSGASWQTLDTYTGEFKTLNNIEDLNEVKSKGMTIETFNSIGTKWNEVIKGMRVRFGYYLEIEEMDDIVNVDKLEVVIDVLGSWEALIHELDYDYEYDNEKIYIELYRDGSYKINYI